MLSKTLLVSAFAALAAAQSSVLTFTKVPNPVTDGQPQAITYATNDTASPVTIVLRKGASGNLQTVATLTSSATGGQYIWTPPAGLANDNDYALEIRQGNQINYYGPFQVQGASASASGYPAMSMSSASMTATMSSNSTTTPAPVVPVMPVGTAGSMSAGTGSALPRNTTMSMATLTASASSTGTGSATTSGTSGAGFQGSSTGSSPSSTASSAASEMHLGSSVALFGAIAAAVFMQ